MGQKDNKNTIQITIGIHPLTESAQWLPTHFLFLSFPQC